MRRALFRLADNRRPDSWATRLRQRRLALFRAYLDRLPRPLRLLDVGGTPAFWDRAALSDPTVEIVLLNLPGEIGGASRYPTLAGDATDLRALPDGSFDVLFSNSVIEHVGDRAAQQRMAREVHRVARHHWVQTPNRAFPLEPHFLVPGFQFLPERLQVALVQRFALGWYERQPDRAAAEALVRSVRLLTRAEMCRLFPQSHLHAERVAGMVKSWVAIGGPRWSKEAVKR